MKDADSPNTLRSLPVSELKLGMRMPGDVYLLRADGRKILLFASGQEIQTERQLWQLSAHGVEELVIDMGKSRLSCMDAGTCSPRVQTRFDELRLDLLRASSLRWDSMKEQQRIQALAACSEAPHLGGLMDGIVKAADLFRQNPDLGLALYAVDKLGDAALRRAQLMSDLLQQLALHRNPDTSREELTSRSLAGLLMDIGQVDCEEPVEEQALPADYKMHPLYGETILRQIPGLPGVISTVAAQHHERLEGQGFPAGISGADIHPLALEAGLCSSWLDLVEGQGGRRALPHAAALSLCRAWRGREFPAQLVDDFCNCLGPWPVGSTVELEDGECGLVAMKHGEGDLPVVAIRSGTGIRLDDLSKSRIRIRRGRGGSEQGLHPEEVF